MRERLRALREKRNLTAEDMAKALGLKSISSYTKKELGYTPVTLEQAMQISMILGCSVEDIFLPDFVPDENA